MNTPATEGKNVVFLRRTLTGSLLALFTLIPGGVLAASSADDNGIPGLLQFAEKYHESPQPALPAATSLPMKKKTPSPVTKESRLRDTRLQQQQHDKIVSLEQQVVRLTAERDAVVQKLKQVPIPGTGRKPAPEIPALPALGQLVQGVRQAVGVTLDEKQANNLVALAREREVAADVARREIEQVNQSLQKKLASYRQQQDGASKEQQAANEQLDALQKQLASLQHEQSTWKSDLAAAQVLIKQGEDRDATLRKERDDAIARTDLVQAAFDAGQAELIKVKTAQKTQGKVTAVTLDDDVNRQSYAAGVSLSHDIQSVQNEHRAWGFIVNEKALLAGIIDGVTGNLQLSPEALSGAQASADAALNSARYSVIKREQAMGDKYIAEFKRQPGVKKSPFGFWFRIDYPGDIPIVENAVVSVVVKEALTDGTVIQDMETSDRLLSQPMSDYPPLFQAAIKELRNHGELTMVVPPVLAYGDKGYPPNVPPNATIVYTLRIDEAYVTDTSPAKKL